MKIAIGPFEGEIGGVSQHILNIIKYSDYKLDPLHQRLSFLSRSKNKKLRRWVRNLNKDYGKRLSKKLADYDIVHLHGIPYWPEIYQKPKLRKAKYIYTVHAIFFREDFETEQEWKAKSFLNKQMFKFCKEADAVISVSKWQQDFLIKKGIHSIYIPNCVDIEECKSASGERFRKKYQIFQDFYLFPANIKKIKRPKLFVELARKMPNRLFVMVGRNLIKKNLGQNIPENVICLGTIPHKDILNAFLASRVVILPSKNESFGIVILEAMAQGKTVVAANHAGPKEIIDDEVDGFLFEPDNLEDLYLKAKRAWEAQEMGIEARKKAEKFDAKITIKEIDKLYKKLMS